MTTSIRLNMAKTRKREIEQNIQTLEKCKRNMNPIQEQTDTANSNFAEASFFERTEWNGENANNFKEERVEVRSSGRSLAREMETITQTVTKEVSSLQTELTAVINEIRMLEQQLQDEMMN